MLKLLGGIQLNYWRDISFPSPPGFGTPESWVMTKRVRLQVHASETIFLQRFKQVTLFNKMRIFEIQKSLNIKPLVLKLKELSFDGLAM